MRFASPAGKYIRPMGSPRIVGNFRVTNDFGPTTNTLEPKTIWPGGEGIPKGTYRYFHPALDIADAKCGSPWYSPQDGKVTFAGVLRYVQNGKVYRPIVVKIDHGGGWSSEHWHLLDKTVVVGQHVTKGQLIGHEGATGNASACHTHSKLWLDGKLKNLWLYLEQNVTCHLDDDSGINIRTTAKIEVNNKFATTIAGRIVRIEGAVDLGPQNAELPWKGTVTGGDYIVAGVSGNKWESIVLDDGVRYVASPLAHLSA